MNLALFDFDGTITSEDTYTKFIFYSTPTPYQIKPIKQHATGGFRYGLYQLLRR